ncbi:PIG-L deacetylase family protein [Desulfocurvus sp.]|jgi:LmbE family N-acetylglucosaminyl deacetylase|uniref:PIG-L deacetylase family protein n=1 Tax=Desulfocurvus sp. TaxID=2871698 RepID=UPI0025C29363|nr:PIG-L deacetylase family protein [Desulfocurvus sp.]
MVTVMHKCILAIVAHPDDEVLGCGGTLARLADEGWPLVAAVLSAGATSRLPGREEERRQQAALKDALGQAACILGVKEVRQFDFPDNAFDSVPLLEIVRVVETLVQECCPSVVFTHHSGDLNVDHCVTARAVLTATRPQGRNPVRTVLSFEVPSSTEWSFGGVLPAFTPNVFFDVTATLERKLAAMEAYAQEGRPFPHPRSLEALRMLSGVRGSACGLQAAEAFMLVRHVVGAGVCLGNLLP